MRKAAWLLIGSMLTKIRALLISETVRASSTKQDASGTVLKNLPKESTSEEETSCNSVASVEHSLCQ